MSERKKKVLLTLSVLAGIAILIVMAAAVYFEARMRLLLSGSAVFGTVNREGIVVELQEGKMLMYDRTDLR